MRNLWALVALAVCIAAPCSTAGAQTTAPADLEQLKALVAKQAETIRDLQERLTKLEGSSAAVGAQVADGPPVPTMTLPGPTSRPPAAGQSGAASALPDIAVFGNNLGRMLTAKGEPSRSQFRISELELALQQRVADGVLFRSTLAAGEGADFAMGLEEGYVTFTRLGVPGLGGSLGKRRLPFGKLNSIHPHAAPYAETPSALRYLADPDGLAGNGVALNWLLPVPSLFANIELGAVHVGTSDAVVARPDVTGATLPLGFGATGTVPMGRLWLSKALNTATELEMGSSALAGKADSGDAVRLVGADVTLKQMVGAFSRWQVQGEALWHTRRDAGSGLSHTRSGAYVAALYAPDQYREFGLRYDDSRLPWPLEGGERLLSLIWSNRLTESSLWRLQLAHGDRTTDALLPSRRGLTELTLQFVWGAGSHSHPLQ